MYFCTSYSHMWTVNIEHAYRCKVQALSHSYNRTKNGTEEEEENKMTKQKEETNIGHRPQPERNIMKWQKQLFIALILRFRRNWKKRTNIKIAWLFQSGWILAKWSISPEICIRSFIRWHAEEWSQLTTDISSWSCIWKSGKKKTQNETKPNFHRMVDGYFYIEYLEF